MEDDEGIGRSLARTLEGHGYTVDWVRTGEEALRAARPTTALVVLDLGLPDLDGLEVCRRLRERTPSPEVLMLTARQDEADVVLGLDAGADDYLVKPFRLAELLARVRACLRRHPPDDDRILVGDLLVEADARQVSIDGREVELRPKEFDLLLVLARDAGRVVSRERLMAEVWDEHWFGSTKTLDVTVSTLRRKLDEAKPGAVAITTLRGVGYRLERS